MRPRRNAPIALALAALGLQTACGEEPAAPEPGARPVKILEFRSSGPGQVLEYPGTISAVRRADLGFEVAGKIVEFPVSEGQSVEAGEVIARLDPRDFEAELEKERANTEAARAEFERQKALFEAKVVSQQQYDRALRTFQVTEARIKTAEKAVEDAVLVAPFAGRVARKLADQFQNVQAKEPIATLQADEGLEIRVAIPERDAARMTPGLTLEERTRRARPTVSVSSIPDAEFPARLTEFTTEADPVTRTFSATLVFDAPDDTSVLPGMTANVRIHVAAGSGSTASRIPARAALGDDAGGASVWVVDPESMQARRRAVTLGELSGEDVEVRDGLRDGDWVVVSGVHQLREGMPVRRYDD